jgi:multicomponent Na+:H+ antiporter subunit F
MNLDALDVALGFLAVSLLLALARAVRGPSLPDRVVALELTSMTSVGIILVRAVQDGSGYLLDIAIVLALVAFLGSVALAYFIERRSPE